MTEKEITEKSVFEKFKKAYVNFPSGQIEHIDKPDFIIHSKEKIGIEITQIFKDDFKSEKGSILKSFEETTKRVSSELLHLLIGKQIPKCFINIHLNENEFPIKYSPKEIAKIILTDILKNILLDNKNYILEITNYGHLPNVIDSYDIIFNEKIKNHEFIESYSAVGGIIDNLKIQNILDKKEESKKSFGKCDKFWLVIKSGELSSDYFPTIRIDKEKLNTTFDKVFILKYLESELIQIK
ncbi:hypothetical protein SAMN04487911_1583 [Arenibacter nanhaiticus]|uniref:Uncharacterized protein n=1 Tax=Arenibacter nanhaiticus TaxID=558155 RepID=A0A1M6N833_9FLAO|nr:hypothetical protein [Arenibacter nanhaiticus]SHJ91875.1 hypothetical protein SAMN04487911_1583 [Arenibacter nanhaiticus]